MASSAASGLLARQLKLMQSDKDMPGISCGLVGNNVFEWEVMLMISDDCKYYGGKVNEPDAFCYRRWCTTAEVQGKRARQGKGKADDGDVHMQEASTALTSSSPPSTPISRRK